MQESWRGVFPRIGKVNPASVIGHLQESRFKFPAQKASGSLVSINSINSHLVAFRSLLQSLDITLHPTSTHSRS